MEGDTLYNLAEYVKYKGQPLTTSHFCLAWSKKSGYHFLQAGFCVGDVKIIGVKEEKKDA